MALKVTVRMGGDSGATVVDYTNQIPVWEVSESGPHSSLIDAGMMFGNGSACQYQFSIIDDLGEIPRAAFTKNLPGFTQVTVSENGPGYEAWLSRGRISDKGIGRGDHPWADSRTFRVTVNDGNQDLKDLALVAPWARGSETGRARVLALIAAFLNGSPRLTTVISNHLVATGGEVSMPAKTYAAGTELATILDDCAQVEGKLYGVVIHHQASASHLCFLYLDEEDHTTYLSTLAITDSAPNLTTSFPPIWDQGDAAVENADDAPISHIVSTYGAGEATYVVASDATRVTSYDYRSRPHNDSLSVTAGQATSRAAAILNSRRTEHVTHQVTIQIPATKADLLCAGMSITIRSAASMGGQYLGTTQTRRISQLKWEPIAPDVGAIDGFYLAHMQLDRPIKVLAEKVGLPVGPKPASTGSGNLLCNIVDQTAPDSSNVISSGAASGFFEYQAADCNESSSWSTNGFPVSSQHWAVDLLSAYSVSRWRILQQANAANSATAVNLWATNDAAKYSGIGNPHDFSAAGWTLITAITGMTTGNNAADIPATADYRYWAFDAAAGGGNGWAVAEFELHGAGDTTEPVGGSGSTGTNSGTYANIDHIHGHGTHASGDLHLEYQKESEKAAANGYASLGATALVPQSQLPQVSSMLKTVLGMAPIAYWRLGETSGTVATDAGGNGYHGTYVGSPTLGVAGLLTGDANKAVDFPGADTDYMQTPTLSSIGTAFTLAAWITPSPATGDDAGIFISGGASRPYLRHLNDDVVFAFTNSGGTTGSISSSADNAPVGQRRLVVATHDGTTARLYIEGVEVASGATASQAPGALSFRVGRWGTAALPFDGIIDEPAVWNRALSATEIADLYAAGVYVAYQKESEKGVASGYAGLGAGGLVPMAQLATGTADGTKFIRDDGTLVVPGGSLTVQDEGTPLATSATTLNFTGAGVTATGAGATKTVNIPGGGGSSGAAALPLDVAAASVGSGDSFAGTTLDAGWSDLQTTALTTKDASIEGHLILGNSGAIGVNVHRGIDRAFSPAADFSVWTKVNYLRSGATMNYQGCTLFFGSSDPSDGAGGNRCQIYLYHNGGDLTYAFEKFLGGVRTSVSNTTVKSSPLHMGIGTLLPPPIWIAMRRVGSTVSWGMSLDGVEWTWETTTTTIAFTVATIGLAINSHTTATPPRTIFDYIATTG